MKSPADSDVGAALDLVISAPVQVGLPWRAASLGKKSRIVELTVGVTPSVCSKVIFPDGCRASSPPSMGYVQDTSVWVASTVGAQT